MNFSISPDKEDLFKNKLRDKKIHSEKKNLRKAPVME